MYISQFGLFHENRGAIEISEFPELIINLIANQFLEAVSKQPLTMYQQLEEAMTIPKGSINFKRYISNSLIKGNYQKLECDYEPFLFDNKVNRIIKSSRKVAFFMFLIVKSYYLIGAFKKRRIVALKYNQP